MIFEFLMSQTLIHRDLEIKESTVIPQIIIMLNNFTRFNKEIQDMDSDDDQQCDELSNKELYE